MENVKVIKFGGSTFSPLSNVKQVVDYLSSLVKKGQKIIVVISAPNNLTAELRNIFIHSGGNNISSDMDELLTFSDYVGAVVLNHILFINGQNTCLVNGSDSGIMTEGNSGGSRVNDTNPNSLLALFEKHEIIVIPGGQGCYKGETSWLGPNTSDYSAVLIAAMLKQSHCYIHSDVSHVYDNDPNLVEDAKLISLLSYDTMITASKVGSKVIHTNAVTLAKKCGIKIITGLNRHPFNLGTCISQYKESKITVIDKTTDRYTFFEQESYALGLDYFESINVNTLTSNEVHPLSPLELLIPISSINYTPILTGFVGENKFKSSKECWTHIINGSNILNSAQVT